MKSFISHRTSSAMLCALWAAGSLCSVQAAESGSSDPLSTFTLNPLVVTATRTPVELNKAPANISIITGKEIEEAHYTDLSQALRDVSDVYIGNYGTGIGYETSNNFYINGNNNIVWMVDGIIMNTTGVNAPVSAIKNLSNIERIEILKGSASALYGSSAVGGVINIITRQPAEGSQTSFACWAAVMVRSNTAFLRKARKMAGGIVPITKKTSCMTIKTRTVPKYRSI